jgi:hypothetical protein
MYSRACSRLAKPAGDQIWCEGENYHALARALMSAKALNIGHSKFAYLPDHVASHILLDQTLFVWKEMASFQAESSVLQS